MQSTKYGFEQMKKLTDNKNEEDPTVDDLFNVACYGQFSPSRRMIWLPRWEMKMYAMLTCNDQQNQQAFEQADKDGFLFCLIHVNVQTDTRMIALQKIGDFVFFLPGEFGGTLSNTSPQNAADFFSPKLGTRYCTLSLECLSEPRLSELAFIKSNADKSPLNFVLFVLSG
jgi:hypothetical protein